MALSEASRHEMYVKLEEVLGAQVANSVMEHLPPVGWADVATKHDLDALSALFEAKLDTLRLSVESKLDGLRVEMHTEINRLLLWLFPTMVTLLTLAFAAAKLS